MLTIKELRGVIPPIITPVDENEKLDVEALRRVIDHVIDGGVHGVFVMGSNGEFYGVDEETYEQAIRETVIYVNKRVPVYAGIGSISTKSCIKAAKMIEAAGADAITILTPMFIKPSESEMFEHFSTIAKSTKLPIVLYNNPGKTTNNISVSLLKKLANIENIIGIKNTSLDFSQTVSYILETKSIPNFVVLSGTDYYIYATLMYGGTGCVAGTANVAPALVVEIYDKFLKGDFEGALDAQLKLVPLRDSYDYGSFPVVMKDCLNLMGLEVGHPIKPIDHCSAERMQMVKQVLESLELL